MASWGVDVRVAEPCSESWDGMRGDARLRHCERCAKSVHNLAAMTKREMEALAIRQVMGEEICARVTRDARGELVNARTSQPWTRAAGVVLSAALAAGVAHAQSAGAKRAVLTGRLVGKDGGPLTATSGQVWLRDDAGTLVAQAPLAKDGSFEVAVAPGNYEIQVGNVLFGHRVKNAALHAGEQSVGNLRQGFYYEQTEWTTTGGAMVSTISGPSWFRHPLLFARYVGWKATRSFRD